MFVLLIVPLLLHKACGAPAEFRGKDGLLVKEVPMGESVLLQCKSNDGQYNFDYWLFAKENIVIGPSNRQYDRAKYLYEILSGNLTIRAVTPNDAGMYVCVSKGVKGGHVNVENVRVTVVGDWEEVYEHDSTINTIRILIVLIALVILAIIGYYVYTIWRDRYIRPSYLEEDDDDDEESAEEIFSAPSTSGMSNKPAPVSPSKPAGPIVLDQNNPFTDISTDFKSILDVANDK